MVEITKLDIQHASRSDLHCYLRQMVGYIDDGSSEGRTLNGFRDLLHRELDRRYAFRVELIAWLAALASAVAAVASIVSAWRGR